MYLRPALLHFLLRPSKCPCFLHVQHYMIVIAHHRIGVCVIGRHIRKEPQLRHQPLLALVTIRPILLILPTQLGRPHIPHIDVKKRRLKPGRFDACE